MAVLLLLVDGSVSPVALAPTTITCRDVITRALRMTKILSAGESMTADEADDGMLALQGMYDAWTSGGMFGRLNDVYTTVDYTALEGDRIRNDGATVTIPDTYSECGLEGSDRAPRDLALIEVYDVTDAERSRYLFDRVAWTRMDALELTNPAPLAIRGLDGLAACLALDYAGEFGAEIPTGVVRRAAMFRTALSLKWGSTRDSLGATYF